MNLPWDEISKFSFLIAGFIIIILCVVRARNAQSVVVYVMGIAIGGVIAVVSIISLLNFRYDPSGVTVSLQRIDRIDNKINENASVTEQIKKITEELKEKTASLEKITAAVREQGNKTDTALKITDVVVKERSESEAKFSERLLVAERKFGVLEKRMAEIGAQRVNTVISPAPVSTAIVQINTTPIQLEKAKKVRDMLTRAGVNATIMPTTFEEFSSKFESGTVNLVYLQAERDLGTKVRDLVDAAKITRRIGVFRQVSDLDYASVQLNLW